MRLRVSNLAVEYAYKNRRTLALQGVDFEVGDELVVLLGLSGTGKSTLLRVLGGLVGPSKGSVSFSLDREIRRGMVFQDYSLLPWLSALENVLLPMHLRKLEGPREATARALLQEVGLGEVESKYPHELSGGMRQRVAVAAAIGGRPDLLLLDEPFGALDAVTREDLQELLDRLYSTEGMMTFFVTHDVEEAVFLADRILIFSPSGGRIVAEIIIPFPRPRSLGIKESPVFQRYRHEAFDHLRRGAEEIF